MLNLAPKLKAAVDVLLMQGVMTRKQMAAALHTGYNNCTTNIIGPLIRQGWIIENGGKLTLKQL